MLKTTPFTDIHIALGAKMAEFAGFNMPIQYPTGINQEHMIVREGVGVFDVSHMGEFWVKGDPGFPAVYHHERPLCHSCRKSAVHLHAQRKRRHRG